MADIEKTGIPIEATANTDQLSELERRLEGVQQASEATNRKFVAGAKGISSAARQEADAVKAAYEVKRRAVEDAERALSNASKGQQDAARRMVSAAKAEADALHDVAKAAEEKARALERSSDGAIKAETQAVREQTDALKQQEVQQTLLADARQRGLERARDMASRWGDKGQQGLSLGAELAGDYQDGAGASAKLDAMFSKIGETDAAIEDLKDNLGALAFDAAMPDDDPINAAAAGLAGFGVSAEQVKGIMPGLIGQSRLYNQSLESVSEAFGRAFSKGDAASLRRSGIVIPQETLDRIKEMSNEGEKQKAVYEAVRASLDKYALSLTQGMTEGEVAMNRHKLAVDGLREALGSGTDLGKQKIDALVTSMAGFATSNPDMAKAAGLVLELGSAGAAGVGGIAELAANMVEAARGGSDLVKWLKGIKTAREAGAIATTAAAVAEGELAVATGLAGEALGAEAIAATGAAEANVAAGATAEGASIGFGLMAKGIWGTVAAAGAAVVALGALWIANKSWEANRDKILSPTSSTTDKRTDKQKEDDQTKLETLNDIRERSKGLSARDRYVVNRKLSAGYQDLGDNDTASDLTIEADALRKQLPKNFTTANSRDAQLLLKTIRGLNTGKNTAARLANDGFKGFGHNDSTDSTAKKLQAQGEKIQADAARALAGETPDIPTAKAPRPSLLSRARSMFSGDASGDRSPFADEIERVQRELHYARGKANKGKRQQLQDELFELKEKDKDWKEAHAAQVKSERAESAAAKKAAGVAEREANKKQKEAERLAKQEAKAADKKQHTDDADGTMLQSLERQNKANAQIRNLEDALDDARDAKNAALVGQLTGQISRIKADTDLANELDKAALEDGKARRSAMEVAAKLRHDDAIDAARHEARRAERDVRERAEQEGKSRKKEKHGDTHRNGSNPSWKEGSGFLPNGMQNGYGMRPATPQPLPSQTPYFEPQDPTLAPSFERQRALEEANARRAGTRTMTGVDGKTYHIGKPIRIGEGRGASPMALSTMSSMMSRIPLPNEIRPQTNGGSLSDGGMGSGRMPDTTFKDYSMRQVGRKMEFTSRLTLDAKEISQWLGVNQRGRLRS